MQQRKINERDCCYTSHREGMAQLLCGLLLVVTATQVATAIMNQWSKAHPGAKHNQWSEETAFYFKETTITTVKLSVSDYEAIWLLAWLLPTALGLLPPVTIPLQNWDKPSAYRQNWTNLLLINWTNQLHMEVNENNASRIKSQTNSLLMEQ